MNKYLNKIIQGDCLEVMKGLEAESIDLVVTSPPYNLGNNHHTGSKKHFAYDDDMDETLYQNSQLFVLNELYRIVKKTGSIFYNHKNRIKEGLSLTPYNWILKSKWQLKQELVWFNGSQNFDKIRFYPMTERIYWLVKSPQTILNNVINHHDLFDWQAEGTNKEHTRAFPEKMVRDILLCLPDAKTVVDPYMGSGTVAKVAKELNRNFIGIEISPEYCKIAEKRLGQEVLF